MENDGRKRKIEEYEPSYVNDQTKKIKNRNEKSVYRG